MIDFGDFSFWALGAHLVGAAISLVALVRTRTAQGTVAWIVSLNTLPWLAVPAWWLFGRSRFHGYVTARRGKDQALQDVSDAAYQQVKRFRDQVDSERGGIRAAERLARIPLLRGNAVKILVDGEATYEDLFRGMEEARTTLLVEYYTVRDDEVGSRLQEIMLRKAKEGVAVRFLYDGAGSYALPEAWLDRCREGGVEVAGFQLTRGIRLRSQLNFRNHRKIVVVDGRVGWLGGLNIGEEYLGRDPDIGEWRDTHMRVTGPAVLGLQLTFLEDWHWASGEIPELDWTPHPAPGGEDLPVLVIPSGPADGHETASLLMQHTIHSADHRLWISSPYFVPDEGVMGALKLAALRGVDVRLMVPCRPDNIVVHLASFGYFGPLLDEGVRIFRYGPGLLHAKTLVLDDGAMAVGTLNLDNRSLRLNFEVTALVLDPGAAARMAEIFQRDLAGTTELHREMLEERPLLQRLGTRAALLLAPIL
jgi:cardiolipin synthase